MLIALLAGLFAVIAAFLVLLDRKDARATGERSALDAAWRGEVSAFIARLSESETAHREQVATLCQRLQAPEAAVYEHAAARLPDREVTTPMSDEETARAEERQRLIAFIEANENGGS